MFDQHQTAISEFARHAPSGFERALVFVVLTIRNSIANLPGDMDTAYYGDADQAGIFFGHKRLALEHIRGNLDALYEGAEDIFAREPDPADSLVYHFLQIPGIGAVKAGFCAQLVYGVSGCLDRHNIDRFGLSPAFLRSDRYKRLKLPADRRRRVTAYNDMVMNCGGTRVLWDGWCSHVAAKYPKTYEHAFAVSALHYEAIID